MHSGVYFFMEGTSIRKIKLEDDKANRKRIQTMPSIDAEAKRLVIHWHIDNSVTSRSCLPTNWTPSIRLSMWHLRGSSAKNTSPFPTFVVSILRIRFPIATIKISCKEILVVQLQRYTQLTTKENKPQMHNVLK
jgi:hypothetical protein